MTETTGSNSITAETVDALVMREMQLRAEEEKAMSVVKDVRARKKKNRGVAKSMGVKSHIFEQHVKNIEAMDDSERFADLKMEAKLAKLAGLPLGGQLDLLDDRPEDSAIAYARGRAAYIKGVDASENPYDKNSAFGQRWLEGHIDGQRSVAAGMGPISEHEAELDKPKLKKKPGRKKKPTDEERSDEVAAEADDAAAEMAAA